MIFHCTRKLADRLPDVSKAQLAEVDSLGSWHAGLFMIDRRQCVMFCHDQTRYCLFLPGVRAPQFAELGRWHREIFLASLATEGVEERLLKRVECASGPAGFDMVTDRSVVASMTIARRDLDGMLMRVEHLLDLDPVLIARHLNERPAMAGRVLHWPAREMLERIKA